GGAGRETFEHAGTLDLVQGRGGGEVQAQLHPRVGGVHSLTARPGGMGELLDQLCGGDAQAAGCARSRGHEQVVHAPGLPSAPVCRVARTIMDAGYEGRTGLARPWPYGADGGTMGPWLIRSRP